MKNLSTERRKKLETAISKSGFNVGISVWGNIDDAKAEDIIAERLGGRRNVVLIEIGEWLVQSSPIVEELRLIFKRELGVPIDIKQLKEPDFRKISAFVPNV